MIKKIILSILLFTMTFTTFSYEVDLPDWGNDIQSKTSITVNETFYISISKIVTKYLWYIMWSISFGMLLYAWILLMKSEWEDKELKKANKIIIWWVVWLFTSLLSYWIVNLIINLW